MLTNALARYSTTPSSGQRRAITLNLVVFFAFTLTAVVMLTRTAMAANAINRDVASAIEPAVVGINEGTKGLPVLDTTAQVTGKIAAAAEPLPGHLASVVDSTGRIDSNLASTQKSATGIGSSVDSIKASTGVITSDAGVLNELVDDIHRQADGIDTSLSAVARLSSSMVKGLSGANASLTDILRATGPLNRAVGGIQESVPRIREHAQDIANSPILLRNGLAVTSLLGNVLEGN